MADFDARARVLVVEDSLLLAEVLCDVLVDGGYLPIGPVSTVEAGLRSIDDSMVDAAMVDIRLKDETSFPLCDVLRKRSIPFLFLTGSSTQEVPAAFADVPVLPKPCEATKLLGALDSILSLPAPAPGAATQPSQVDHTPST